jgi:hypothetical protein
MSKKDKAKQVARKSSRKDADDEPGPATARSSNRDNSPELLPSEMNEAADTSPRIAFLAYN